MSDAGSVTPDAPARSELDRLRGYIADARSLHDEISTFQHDRKLEEADWTFHYAVDTDVVQMFVDPQRVGPTYNNRKGYGIVFHDDTEAQAINLSCAMARFLFYVLAARSRPFLLMHGHDAEVRSVYDATTRNAENDKYRLRDERKQLLEELRRIESASESDIDSLADKFPAIMRYLFLEGGPTRDLIRFQDLLSKQCIARLRHAIHSADFYIELKKENPEVHKILSYPDNLQHQIEESKLRIEWQARLEGVRKKSGHRMKADYSALARIELLNRYLEKHKHRVLLITGDLTITRAASKYLPEHSRKSFRINYIRSPRAFLAAPEVITPFQRPNTEMGQQAPVLISDWLNYLLAFRALESGGEKTEFSLDSEEDAGRLATEIRERWSNHIEALQEVYGVINTDARHELQNHIQGAEKEDFYELVKEIADDLEFKSSESWNEFLDTTVTAGYALLETEDDFQASTKRNAPTVMVSNFGTAYSLIRQIAAKKDEPYAAREKIEALTADRRDSESQYLKALAYGVLFASRGRWVQAQQLAEHALQLPKDVDELQEPGRPIVVSGREAHYLRSISIRMNARSPKDLDGAKLALLDAQGAFEKEGPVAKGPAGHDIRFRCERINLDLAEHLFAHFLSIDHPQSQCGLALTGMAARYQGLISEISAIGDDWIRLHTERSIYTNIIMISALLEDIGIVRDIAEYVDLLSASVNEGKNNESLPLSYLVESILLYAKCSVAKGSLNLRRSLQNDLNYCQHKLTNMGESVVQTPYDRMRFSLLFRLSHRHLAKWESV